MLVYGEKGPATHVMLHYVYMKKSCLYGRKGPETGLQLCFKEVRRRCCLWFRMVTGHIDNLLRSPIGLSTTLVYFGRVLVIILGPN